MPNAPKVCEKIVSNVWFHTMQFDKAGDYKVGHKHNFDHAHLVCKGSVELFEAEHLDGAQSSERVSLGIYKQGDILLVPCNKSHSVMALEDNTFCACVQAVRDSETNEIVSAFNDGTTWKAPSRIVL